MTEHPPILLENLGFSFDLRRSKKRVRRSMIGKVQRLDENGKFWAVRNISLRVESGESLAVIGANGAGKSNFIGIFRFLAALTGDNFPVDVQNWGGPDALLHYGRKVTDAMEFEVYFAPESGVANGYKVTLAPTRDNRLIFTREQSWINGHYGPNSYPLGVGHDVAKVTSDEVARSKNVSRYVAGKLKVWRQYHFHDTGDRAAVKQEHQANDTLRLKRQADHADKLSTALRRLHTCPLHR